MFPYTKVIKKTLVTTELLKLIHLIRLTYQTFLYTTTIHKGSVKLVLMKSQRKYTRPSKSM